MSIADDLQKLEQLRVSGALTDSEFEQAKQKLLEATPSDHEQGLLGMDKQDEDSLGTAANRYVTYRTVTGVISLIIFLIALLFILSKMSRF